MEQWLLRLYWGAGCVDVESEPWSMTQKLVETWHGRTDWSCFETGIYVSLLGPHMKITYESLSWLVKQSDMRHILYSMGIKLRFWTILSYSLNIKHHHKLVCIVAAAKWEMVKRDSAISSLYRRMITEKLQHAEDSFPSDDSVGVRSKELFCRIPLPQSNLECWHSPNSLVISILRCSRVFNFSLYDFYLPSLSSLP